MAARGSGSGRAAHGVQQRRGARKAGRHRNGKRGHPLRDRFRRPGGNGGSRPAADTGNDRFGLHERMGGRGRDRRFRRCQRNSAVGDRFGQLHPQCETDLQRQFMDAGRAAVLAEDRREHNGSRFLRLLSLQRVGCRPHGDSL